MGVVAAAKPKSNSGAPFEGDPTSDWAISSEIPGTNTRCFFFGVKLKNPVTHLYHLFPAIYGTPSHPYYSLIPLPFQNPLKYGNGMSPAYGKRVSVVEASGKNPNNATLPLWILKGRPDGEIHQFYQAGYFPQVALGG